MVAPTIAVVNHSPAFSALLGIALKVGGYEMLVCLNAETAHELILANEPALVLIDTRIGEHDDGWGVLKVLRNDALTMRIPIIVTSTDPNDVAASAAELSTMIDVRLLPKPFTPEGVLKTIGEMLRN